MPTENLFEALDVFTYAVMVLGGLLAILWIYNSTIKERRGVLRRARRAGNPAVERIVDRGIFFQRLGFGAATAATGLAILWFARGYYDKYHVNIAPAYFVAAAVLVGLGLVGMVLAYLFRPKG
jgi:hypothetical protein